MSIDASIRTIAVTGATGYIGTRLVPRLLEAGYAVRCLVRSPRKLDDRQWRHHERVDVRAVVLTDPVALAEQLRGCHAAYYLVHSMESAGADYAATDEALARNFALASASAELDRVIFLGGLGDDRDDLSPHLASRREVERALFSGPVPVTAFRAAMIIGSGSASFEILRYLAERLPIMITPRWVSTECQPIFVRNVLFYLVQCLAVPDTTGQTLEIGGPEIVTYRQLLQVMAAARGLKPRLVVPVPVLTPFLSSLWIHLVTPISARMARPLAEGLRNRVVVNDHTAEALMPQPLSGVREAIESALAAEASADVESTWSSAGPMPGDPDWAGGDVFIDQRERLVAAPAERVFGALLTLGGAQGWLRYNSLWRARGVLDRLAGGPGWKRTRRHPARLSWGEAVGFWRVSELIPGQRLTLHAEMRVPGVAVLDFALEPDAANGGTRLTQTAKFRPRGLAGPLYWYAVLPFHGLVFRGLLDGIAAEAESTRAPTPAAPLAPPQHPSR